MVELNTKLAAITYDLIQQHQPFAVLGGDHSCAIGTWSGVAAALAQQQNGELGLIGSMRTWIVIPLKRQRPVIFMACP